MVKNGGERLLEMSPTIFMAAHNGCTSLKASTLFWVKCAKQFVSYMTYV